MSNTERVLKRLRRNRPMLAVTLRIPEDVIDDLKRIAPSLGHSGYQPLIRAYIGQGLRQTWSDSRNLSWTRWLPACAGGVSTKPYWRRRWRRCLEDSMIRKLVHGPRPAPRS